MEVLKMKKQIRTLKVVHVEYLKCSYYGNPKKRLLLMGDYDDIYTAETATNAMCGYLTYQTGKKYVFTYHFTPKTCKMIIDFAKEA
jgi:hypothetical protein